MAVTAWLTVITGTWVVYPWYREKVSPPDLSGCEGLSIPDPTTCSPRDFLLSDVSGSTKDWHEFGMEWKERVAWISPILATVVAFIVLYYGGIGAAALGLFTTLAEASTDLKEWLDFKSDVGPLSGKTIMAVIVWLVAWAVLHVVYRDKPQETRRALTIAVVLVALGVLGTFPTFFQAFTAD
ncbi:MAG TPA: hypothetical protein VFU14_12120 [Acidimicrobiales bacterium]|nr:hypothetical protein [Acidimicrobiales bacterium]